MRFLYISVVAEVLQEADEEGWCLLLRAAALPPDGATRFTVGSLSLRTRLFSIVLIHTRNQARGGLSNRPGSVTYITE
jgi:hypothetical protein